jgi:hypothetical protein
VTTIRSMSGQSYPREPLKCGNASNLPAHPEHDTHPSSIRQRIGTVTWIGLAFGRVLR